mmetsp:Transcript_14550/g.17650  ORF Transcript_14550/g.17650 Transcript_14550/m.17650 type:complete len:365 (-) Transcript_14550:1201-2295(-)
MGDSTTPNPESTPEAVENQENSTHKGETISKAGSSEGAVVEQEQKDGSYVEVEVHHSEEEVVDRLFNVEHLNKDISSIWGWASSVSESISETVKKSTEEFKEKVDTVSKDLHLDGVVQQVSASVKDATDTIKSNVNSLNKEEAEAEAKKAEKRNEARQLYPWEPETRFSTEIKERIMRLSDDNNTFLIPPPEQLNFTLDLTEKVADGAKLMLEADKKLSKKRFELVPRQVDEDTFFRNYFYRVELIKRSYGVNETTNEHYSQNSGETKTEAPTEKDVLAEEDEVQAKREKSSSLSWEDELQAELDDELQAELDDEANFDMFDDDELLAAVNAEGEVDINEEFDEDDGDIGLEERIKAELNLSGE